MTETRITDQQIWDALQALKEETDATVKSELAPYDTQYPGVSQRLSNKIYDDFRAQLLPYRDQWRDWETDNCQFEFRIEDVEVEVEETDTGRVSSIRCTADLICDCGGETIMNFTSTQKWKRR